MARLIMSNHLADIYNTLQLWGKGSVWGGSAWRGATGSNMAATTVRSVGCDDLGA